MKLLKKYKFDNLINEYSLYTKEFVEYIINITSNNFTNEDENDYIMSDNNKAKILEYFQRSDFYSELNLVCGLLLYYGIDKIIEKDYIKSLE